MKSMIGHLIDAGPRVVGPATIVQVGWVAVQGFSALLSESVMDRADGRFDR